MTQAMPPKTRPAGDTSRWARMQDQSHIERVQELIRDAIRMGSIRVLPHEDGRVRIVPAVEHEMEW